MHILYKTEDEIMEMIEAADLLEVRKPVLPLDSMEKKEPVNPKDLIGVKKAPLHLVPVAGIIHEAMAMKDGAAKYGPHNWREYQVIASVYMDAALRHIYSWFDGEEIAEDSGVHHLGHAKACLGIILDAMENGQLSDDRPLPGATPRMLAEIAEKLGEGS